MIDDLVAADHRMSKTLLNVCAGVTSHFCAVFRHMR